MEQPLAVRVPRLRGTHTGHRTVLDVWFYETVPPKGGTLTAAGTASPVAQDNRSLLEYRVYAEHRQITEQCSMFGFMNRFRLKAVL